MPLTLAQLEAIQSEAYAEDVPLDCRAMVHLVGCLGLETLSVTPGDMVNHEMLLVTR